MTTKLTTWYSFTKAGSTTLRCVSCEQDIDVPPQVDHHPRICPKCEVECAYLNWKDRTLQIVPSEAPSEVARVLGFLQQHFDELEYAELFVGLESLMDELYASE